MTEDNRNTISGSNLINLSDNRYEGGLIFYSRKDAVREAAYNALIHSNWADSIPIQVQIEDDAMYINDGMSKKSIVEIDSLFMHYSNNGKPALSA